MLRLNSILWLLLVFLLGVCTPAWAQNARTDAARLSDEAAVAFDEGRVEDAISLLLEAFALVPDPSFAYNLASLYEMQDDPGRAWHFYREYLALFPGATDRAEVEAILADLQSVLQVEWAQVQVEATPEDARIAVVHRDSGTTFELQAPWTGYVRPGATDVTVSAEGFEPVTETFNATAGVVVPLTVTLEAVAVPVVVEPELVPEPDPQPEPEPTPIVIDEPTRRSIRPIIGWSLIGTGVALLGGGAGLLVASESTAQTYNDEVAAIGRGGDATEASLADLESSMNSQRGAGIALLVAGGVSSIVGTFLVVPRGDERTSVSLTPLGRAGALVSFSGRF
jgi:hypothetical protein